MIAVLVFAAIALGMVVGTLFGFGVGVTRTQGALKLARYREAIGIAEALVNTPDARDLRPRAQTLLAAHRRANPKKEEY